MLIAILCVQILLLAMYAGSIVSQPVDVCHVVRLSLLSCLSRLLDFHSFSRRVGGNRGGQWTPVCRGAKELRVDVRLVFTLGTEEPCCDTEDDHDEEPNQDGPSVRGEISVHLNDCPKLEMVGGK